MKIKDPKIKKLWEQEVEPAPGVEYRPCLFCGNFDYEFGNDVANVEKTNIFQPDGCDRCNYKNLKGSEIPIH